MVSVDEWLLLCLLHRKKEEINKWEEKTWQGVITMPIHTDMWTCSARTSSNCGWFKWKWTKQKGSDCSLALQFFPETNSRKQQCVKSILCHSKRLHMCTCVDHISAPIWTLFSDKPICTFSFPAARHASNLCSHHIPSHRKAFTVKHLQEVFALK